MSELREEVPGDAGYEVSRFAEKRCVTCANNIPGVNCKNTSDCFAGRNDYHSWKPKPSPVLGETVLPLDEVEEAMRNYAQENSVAFIHTERSYPDVCYRVAQAQDTHTRKCLKEQGWKSPEEFRAIYDKEVGWLEKWWFDNGGHTGVVDTMAAHIATLRQIARGDGKGDAE